MFGALLGGINTKVMPTKVEQGLRSGNVRLAFDGMEMRRARFDVDAHAHAVAMQTPPAV